jgi:polyhydroxyalkanoate synthase
LKTRAPSSGNACPGNLRTVQPHTRARPLLRAAANASPSSPAAQSATAEARRPAAAPAIARGRKGAPPPLPPSGPAAPAPSAAPAPEKEAEPTRAGAGEPGASERRDTPLPDFEALSRNVARLIEEGGKVIAAYLKPRAAGEAPSAPGGQIADIATTLGRVAEYYISDAQRAFEAQAALSTQFIDLWEGRCAGSTARTSPRSPRPRRATSGSPIPNGARTPISTSSSRPIC